MMVFGMSLSRLSDVMEQSDGTSVGVKFSCYSRSSSCITTRGPRIICTLCCDPLQYDRYLALGISAEESLAR